MSVTYLRVVIMLLVTRRSTANVSVSIETFLAPHQILLIHWRR